VETRRIGPDGFAGKDRSWNDRGLVEDWRREWAAHANHALARNGERERIDHRSLASQRQDALDRDDQVAAAELDRPAGVHLGRARHQEIRTRRPSERVSRALEDQPDRPQLRSLREQLVEQERALEREQPELRPSGLERLSSRDRGLRQAIERTVGKLLECVRELIGRLRERERALEAQRERQRQRERALEMQRQREEEARRQRDLRAALREHEALVKAGRYKAAFRLEEQVIDPAKQWGELNKDQEAKDRYEAVRELSWKRSYDQRVGTAPNVTDEDISRAVAERTYDRDRDYGPSR